MYRSQKSDQKFQKVAGEAQRQCFLHCSIIEDPELIDILMDLNSKVVTPSQYTVSCDVKEIFQMSRSKVLLILKVCCFRRLLLRRLVITRFQAHSGKLHLCVDGWTSPNVISFIGLTVHWAADGVIKSMILDFVKWACQWLVA